jgi:hypothetical protein
MAVLPLFKVQTVPTATAAVLGSGNVKLMAFMVVGGSDASGVEFKNAGSDTGTVLISYKVGTAVSSPLIDLSELGGVDFSVGCWCKPSGTGCVVYCWFE